MAKAPTDYCRWGGKQVAPTGIVCTMGTYLVWCDCSVGRKPEDGSFKGCGDSFVTAGYEYSKNE